MNMFLRGKQTCGTDVSVRFLEEVKKKKKRAFDYALYQLYAMVPAHDDRMRLAAKGLSGEGDKGHVFWDTEIFALPCYIFTCPEIAQNLLLYRYRCLEVAKKEGSRIWLSGRTVSVGVSVVYRRGGNPETR